MFVYIYCKWGQVPDAYLTVVYEQTTCKACNMVSFEFHDNFYSVTLLVKVSLFANGSGIT